MPLPKLEVPTYDLKLSSIEEAITFRPFLVKEEKILLTALEGEQQDMIRAMKQIMNNCVETEINLDELPLFDLEYLFLNLRSKSVGETSNLLVTCQECNQENPLSIDLATIELQFPDEEVDSNVMLSDTVGVLLKYPTVDMLKYVDIDIGETVDLDTTFEILEHCIDTLYDGDELYDLQDYTKKEKEEFFNSLTQKQFQDIQEYFDNIPKLSHQVEYKCRSCETEQSLTIEGLQNFFG